MTSTRSTTIGLPRVRAEQLRELARHHGQSVASYLGQIIERERQAAGLADQIPGIDAIITEDPEHPLIELAFDDPSPDGGKETRWPMTPATAVELAGIIEFVAERGGGYMLGDVAECPTVSRRGTGIVIEFGVGEAKDKRTFAPGVAQSLARFIRGAAAQLS